MNTEIKERIVQIQNGDVPEGYKKSKIGNIPNDWETARLKNIFKRITETVGNKKTNVLSITAGTGFVDQKEKFGKLLAGRQYEKYIMLKRGDFSYNKGNSKRYPQGCIYKLTEYEEGAVPNVFVSFRKNLNSINDEYYKHLFISGFLNRQLFRLVNYGVRNDGLLNITPNEFLKTYLPIPPLSEQQKIAIILSTQDKIIELKEKLLAEKKRQKTYLMQVLLNPDSADFKRLPGFIGEWKKLKMKKVCEVKGGKRLPKGYSLVKEKNNYPYIRVSDMNDNGVILDDIRYIPCSIAEKISNYRISSRDIYISVAGTLGLVGIVPIELNNANLTENADKLTNIKCNQKFLYYVMKSDVIQKNIEKTKTNNAQPKLAINQILNFYLYLPEKEEQKDIASLFDIIENEIDIMENNIKLQLQKKKALMQLLLTGKVRVKV